MKSSVEDKIKRYTKLIEKRKKELEQLKIDHQICDKCNKPRNNK